MLRYHLKLLSLSLFLPLLNTHYRATSYEHSEAVKFILSKSEYQPLHNLSTHHETPLFLSCRKKLYSIATMLLDHSPKLVFISEAFHGQSPLHVACSHGDTQMVGLLLQTIESYMKSHSIPINLDFIDHKGQTPLYNACCNGFFEVVELLVEFQKKNKKIVTLDMNKSTKLHRTPLHAAISKGSSEIVQFFLTINAININIEAHPSEQTHRMLIENIQEKKGINLEPPNRKDDTVGNSSQSQYESTTPTSIKPSLSSVSVVPVPVPRSNTTVPAQKKHVISSEDVRMRSQTNTESARSKLMIFEQVETGELVISAGSADSTLCCFDKLLITPLTEACACSHTEIIKMLLQHGARDKKGLACRIAHLLKKLELMSLILSYHTVLDHGSDHCLKLEWGKFKLPLCMGEWVGTEAKFYPKDPRAGGKSQLSCITFDAIQVIYVDNNQLKSIPIEIFQLKNVKKVNISKNIITQLPSLSSQAYYTNASCGWACPCLVELIVSDNQLKNVPFCVWSHPNLRKLFCCNNELETLLPKKKNIPQEVLAPYLEKVELSHNKLTIISNFLFELPGLHHLILSKNQISELPLAVWGCQTLKELNVSSNRLTTLPSHNPDIQNPCSHFSVSTLKQAGNVIVGQCEVKAPIDVATSGIKPLNPRELPVDSEKYEYSSLQEMNLSDNNFSVFPEGLACHAPNLTKLLISQNPLTEIDIQYIPYHLKHLIANECAIERLGNVITKDKHQQIYQSCHKSNSLGMACKHRKHFNLPYLTSLDVSQNKLKYIQLLCQHAQDKHVDFGAIQKTFITNITRYDLLYPGLENLNVIHNKLQGRFNPNIGHQTHLTVLKLSDNEDLLEIPIELGYLKKFKHLMTIQMENLKNLVEPPQEYQNVEVNNLLTYMKSRLKE